MPRYFFDTRDGGPMRRDDIGVDLPDDEAARRHVGRILPDLARRGLPDGEEHRFACDARTEAGTLVYSGSLTYRGTRIPAPADLES